MVVYYVINILKNRFLPLKTVRKRVNVIKVFHISDGKWFSAGKC